MHPARRRTRVSRRPRRLLRLQFMFAIRRADQEPANHDEPSAEAELLSFISFLTLNDEKPAHPGNQSGLPGFTGFGPTPSRYSAASERNLLIRYQVYTRSEMSANTRTSSRSVVVQTCQPASPARTARAISLAGLLF